MSQLVQYEPAVTETVEIFLDQTDKLFAKPNKVCDFAEWLQYFAFDVSEHHPYIWPCLTSCRSLDISLIANVTALWRKMKMWTV